MSLTTFGKRELPLNVSVFPKGSARWHLDWFGPVSFPDRGGLNTSPSIRVQLSRIDEAHESLHPQPRRLIKHVHVTVRTMMILGLGDIWSNGFLVCRNQRERVTFENVPISSKTVRLVKTGTSLSPGNFLLPADEHPWHMQHTHSYCAEVTMADGRHLVIPCPVLLRFYFGSSSALLAKLFRPDLKRTDLGMGWSKSPDGRAVFLRLGAAMPGPSAEDIARILLNRPAWAAANLVRQSCLEASVRNETAYFRSTFPFEGSTTLEVQGVWVSREGHANRTFVVHEIHSCSAPFPFQTLRYRLLATGSRTSQREAPRKSALQSHATTPTTSEQVLRTSLGPRAPELHERDASHNLSPATAFIQARRKFKDLEHKTVYAWKETPLVPPTFRKAKTKDANDAFTLADQGSAAKVRGLTLAESRTVSYFHPPPPFLSPYLQELKQLTHLNTQVVTIDAVDGWTVPMPPRKPGAKKILRACVISVECRHLFATVVIPDCSPTSALVYADLIVRDDDELQQLLERVPADLRKQLLLGAQTVVVGSGMSSSSSGPDQAVGSPVLTATLNRHFR